MGNTCQSSDYFTKKSKLMYILQLTSDAYNSQFMTSGVSIVMQKCKNTRQSTECHRP